jgi:predicted CopG family antitoxin
VRKLKTKQTFHTNAVTSAPEHANVVHALKNFFKCNSPGIPVRESHYGLTHLVTTEEKESFVEVMHDLNEENKRCGSVLGSSSFGNALDDAVIKDISDDLKHVFTKVMI